MSTRDRTYEQQGSWSMNHGLNLNFGLNKIPVTLIVKFHLNSALKMKNQILKRCLFYLLMIHKWYLFSHILMSNWIKIQY